MFFGFAREIVGVQPTKKNSARRFASRTAHPLHRGAENTVIYIPAVFAHGDNAPILEYHTFHQNAIQKGLFLEFYFEPTKEPLTDCIIEILFALKL